MAGRALTSVSADDSVQRPRLLFIVNVAWFFASHRLELARAARAEGYEVHLACKAIDDRAVRAIETAGCTVHDVDLARGIGGPIAELRAIRRLRGILREVRPDIVHCVTIKPVLYGSILARLAGVRGRVCALSGLGHVFTATGGLAALRRRLVQGIYAFAMGGRHLRVIFQNPDDRDTFIANRLVRPQDAVMIRGSGVDLRAYSPVETHNMPPVVLLPARMLREKGIVEFMAAAKLLQRRGVSARFVMAGGVDEGNPSHMTQPEITALAADSGVEWLGHVADMAAVVGQCDVVCLPSYREGLPKALLEAAGCGKPMVSTDVPGCREVVTDGWNGFLVPPQSVEPLADALQKLIADTALRAAMGARARARALQEYSIESVIARTLGLYAELRTASA